MAEEISLEETNRIRIGLGLKPIPIPSVTRGTDRDEMRDEHLKETTNDGSIKPKEELSIEETNKLRISLGLKPIPLPTSNVIVENDIPTVSFVSDVATKKMQQKLKDARMKANMRQKAELGRTLLDEENADEATDDWLNNIGKPKPKRKKKTINTDNYHEEENLSGFKIAHSIEEIGGLKDNEIFTLKDQSILDDNSDDELENDRLVREAKMEKLVNAKMGKETKIRPEDELEREFVMISNGNVIPKSDKKEEEAQITKNVVIANLFKEEEELESLDAIINKPTKFKKPKKAKKEKQKRKLQIDDEEIELRRVELSNDHDELIDDEELQNMLSMKRRKVQRKRKLLTPEEIAAELREAEEESTTSGNIDSVVIDSTNDFLASIIKIDEIEVREDEDVEQDNLKDQIIESRNDDGEEKVRDDEESDHVSNDPNFKGGLSETLKYLSARNIITADSEKLKKSKLEREQKKLADANTLKYEFAESKILSMVENDRTFRGLSKKDKEVYLEQEKERLMHEKARIDEDRLKNYNPNVKLTYTDDTGRELTTKEAYKHLSHQFHGTLPGNKSREKQLRRIEEEKQQMKDSSILVTGGDNGDPESARSAGIRLQ